MTTITISKDDTFETWRSKTNQISALASTSLQQDVNGNYVSIGNGAIGYGTGSGGTVTQTTNKSAPVSLNKVNGQIITAGTVINTGTFASFTFNNNKIAATDNVIVTVASGMTTAGSYNISVDSTSTGLCVISIRNMTGGNLSETLTLNFSVVKVVTA